MFFRPRLKLRTKSNQNGVFQKICRGLNEAIAHERKERAAKHESSAQEIETVCEKLYEAQPSDPNSEERVRASNVHNFLYNKKEESWDHGNPNSLFFHSHSGAEL